MKRVFAMILALAMVFSLSVTAFAEGTQSTTGTGSITITNATAGETYTVYKVFDAGISFKDGKAEGVSYTIDKESKFYEVLFGTDGKTDNLYFALNPNTFTVSKKEGVNDSELIAYLTGLVTPKEGYVVPFTPAASKTVPEGAASLVFDSLPYGYYVITSTLGATVTINSNTPNVEVIDKNQKPAIDFKKQIQTGVNEKGEPIWGDANSANIGDRFSYRIAFTATNYDADKKIKYYQIHDEKGDAIWAEFNSFQVSVGGEKLKRGYYLSQGGENTGNWEYLGDWSDIPEAERDRNDAQWYLVHLGYDTFRITIPWLEGHTVSDVTTTTGGNAYSLGFAENAASKFASPVEVEITYDVVVEANAAIGGTTHGNRFNKASASWTSEHETDTTPPDEVVTRVYGIGLLKDDGATGINLAGAKFRIYSDSECTQPVYVIPTDVDGVYIVDSKGKDIESVTGTGKVDSRKLFAAYLQDYLGENIQDNYVVSQVNGKLAILGLKAGSYFLKEVEAPDGYNALTLPIEIKAGEGSRPFSIFADKNGNVADIQVEDGVHTEHRLDLTHTVVHNSKGLELPSTGGEGRMMLIAFGSVIAMAFAVLMITQKKMSTYRD